MQFKAEDHAWKIGKSHISRIQTHPYAHLDTRSRENILRNLQFHMNISKQGLKINLVNFDHWVIFLYV